MSNGPEPLLTYRGAVYPWHCDHMGHMNVMWYVGKFDEATWNLFGSLGLDRQFLRAKDRGFAAVEQNIVYKKELMPGDAVTVYSVILEIKDRVIRFSHEMRKTDTDEVAATTIITAVHLDTKARKATPFPSEFRDRAQALFVSVTG
jgi:acyl-CoA thioester hydrolase